MQRKLPQKMRKNNRAWAFGIIGGICLVALALPLKASPPPAAATPAAPRAAAPATPGKTATGAAIPAKKSLEEVLRLPFTYHRENRPDPFKPFITEQSGPAPATQEEDAPLTGMQLFEPSQLTLVAILFSGQQAVAMMEDSTGMGHIVKVHDKIGRRGEIKAIVPNAVEIEEWSLTPSGAKRVTTNEMVLRKEGDKE